MPVLKKKQFTTANELKSSSSCLHPRSNGGDSSAVAHALTDVRQLHAARRGAFAAIRGDGCWDGSFCGMDCDIDRGQLELPILGQTNAKVWSF